MAAARAPRDAGRWAAAALAFVGGLAAVLGALGLWPALDGTLAARLPPAQVAALSLAGSGFGLLGCVGAGLTLIGRAGGMAAMLAATAGLAVTGFAVPAGLALLAAAVLLPTDPP